MARAAGGSRSTAKRKRAIGQGRVGRKPISWSWIVVIAVGVLAGGAILLNTLGAQSSTSGQSSSGLVGEVTERVLGPAGAAAAPLTPGVAAPNFQWAFAGEPGSLDQLRGKAVLLELFATWCPHCQAEAPIIARLGDRYGPRGLVVLAVSASPLGLDQRSPASIADIDQYIAKYGARYRHLFDPAIVAGRRYGIRSFPSLFLIDKAGRIQFAQDGEVPESTLTTEIEKALSG